MYYKEISIKSQFIQNNDLFPSFAFHDCLIRVSTYYPLLLGHLLVIKELS